MDVKYAVTFTFDVCTPTGAVLAVPRRFVNGRPKDHSASRVTLY